MGFLLGMLFFGLLILCIILDVIKAVSPVFGCLFLLAVIGFGAYLLIFTGIVLTPLFLAGGLLTLFLWVGTIIGAGESKNGKQ